jgi:penicillin-binding protein 1B
VLLLFGVPLGYAIWNAADAVSQAEARIDDHLAGRQVATPGRVYGRALSLVRGLRPARVHLTDTLERVGYRRVKRGAPGIGQYLRGDETWEIGVRAFTHPDGVEPARLVRLELDAVGRIARLLDAEGESLERVRIEPPVIGFLGDETAQDRIPVALENVPGHVVQAFLAIEDQRFYEHSGIDPQRIAGALVANLKAGRIVQGGSTITQQLARSLFLGRQRVMSRKLQEVAIALALERRLSKAEILELYLNEIYLGQRGSLAVHGVGAAARLYFGDDLADVNVHQAALLAAMARGPSRYSPTRNIGLCRERRDLVLQRMGELGFLPAERVTLAQARPLDLRRANPPLSSARYFIDYLRGALAERHDWTTLGNSGARIFTSLDWRLQAAAEHAVREGLAELENRAPKLLQFDTPTQAALLALDPHSGDVLAMVGGRDYAQTQFNRAVDAKRQPGSAFKPVVALAALAPPNPPFTLASILVDEPILIPPPEPEPGEEPEEPWGPQNHDEGYRGEVTLRQAIEDSLNVPMIRLGQDVGLRRTIETARKLGIRSRLRPVPSLVLGTFEVSLLEMTRAYAVLAAGGRIADVRSVSFVTNSASDVIDDVPVKRRWVVDAQGVFLVTSALEGAVNRGTGRRVRAHGYRGPLAGKTGSSDDYRDGWFIGYTPQIAVGVWVGFDDEQSLGLPGARTALPIFTAFLKDAIGARGGPAFRPPRGVERIEVVSREGYPSGLRCDGEPEWFLESFAPTRHCNSWWLPSVGEGPSQRPRGFRGRFDRWRD